MAVEAVMAAVTIRTPVVVVVFAITLAMRNVRIEQNTAWMRIAWRHRHEDGLFAAAVVA